MAGVNVWNLVAAVQASPEVTIPRTAPTVGMLGVVRADGMILVSFVPLADEYPDHAYQSSG